MIKNSKLVFRAFSYFETYTQKNIHRNYQNKCYIFRMYDYPISYPDVSDTYSQESYELSVIKANRMYDSVIYDIQNRSIPQPEATIVSLPKL